VQPTELVDAGINLIEELNPAINPVIHTHFDRAREASRTRNAPLLRALRQGVFETTVEAVNRAPGVLVTFMPFAIFEVAFPGPLRETCAPGVDFLVLLPVLIRVLPRRLLQPCFARLCKVPSAQKRLRVPPPPPIAS